MSYSWYRAESSIANNPKVLAFEVGIGDPNGLAYVTRLHCWTHIYATTGTFSKTVAAQVEAFCKWRGEPGKLISTFIKFGLIDASRRTLETHDWAEYQGSLVEKSSRDAALKKTKRAEAARAAAETARAARAPGVQPAPAPTGRTDTTDGRDGRSLEPPVLTPAVSVAVEPPPPRGRIDWVGEGQKLAIRLQAQRGVTRRFTPDRAFDVAAVEAWAIAWCTKHEPDAIALGQMYAAFDAFLASDFGRERDCALSVWVQEGVWLPRWDDQRAAARKAS